MAKIRIEHISEKSRNDEVGTEGVAHLPPGDNSDFLTLCGFTSYSYFEDAVGVPTCPACISQAKAVLSSITKKELKSL